VLVAAAPPPAFILFFSILSSSMEESAFVSVWLYRGGKGFYRGTLLFLPHNLAKWLRKCFLMALVVASCSDEGTSGTYILQQ
jgi:hypothetical protein